MYQRIDEPFPLEEGEVSCNLTLTRETLAEDIIHFSAVFYGPYIDLDDDEREVGHLNGVLLEYLPNQTYFDDCDGLDATLGEMAAAVKHLNAANPDQNYMQAVLLQQAYVADLFRGANPGLLRTFIRQTLDLIRLLDDSSCLVVTTPAPMKLDEMVEANHRPGNIRYWHEGPGSDQARDSLIRAHTRIGFTRVYPPHIDSSAMWATARAFLP